VDKKRRERLRRSESMKNGTGFGMGAAAIALALAAGLLAQRAEAQVQATGGTVTNYATVGKEWIAHIFTTVGETNLNVTTGGTVEVLVVGGGGGGGYKVAGGGGAGGVVHATNYTLDPGIWHIRVGDGGGAYTNGAPSIFATNGVAGKKITALGGGAWRFAK
jgi:hypothetical protein